MIYAVLSRLNRCNSLSRCHASAIVVESQKIDELPVLATCWSDTLAILSSEVNGLVGHGSTR